MVKIFTDELLKKCAPELPNCLKELFILPKLPPLPKMANHINMLVVRFV